MYLVLIMNLTYKYYTHNVDEDLLRRLNIKTIIQLSINTESKVRSKSKNILYDFLTHGYADCLRCKRPTDLPSTV